MSTQHLPLKRHKSTLLRPTAILTTVTSVQPLTTPSDSMSNTQASLPVTHMIPSSTTVTSGDANAQTMGDMLSTPLYVYRRPQAGIPTPTFEHGRCRFPPRGLRLHSLTNNNPNRYEVLPGVFDNYDDLWSAPALPINDFLILAINAKPMYMGIHYRIDVHPSAWGNRPVNRGAAIIFRGFEDRRTQYIITWERTHEISDGLAYIQANALRHDGYAVESSDADWPTIGFYIPSRLCNVTPAPIPAFPYNHSDKDDTSFIDPFDPSHRFAPTQGNQSGLANLKRRNAIAPETGSPPTRYQHLKRKLSNLMPHIPLCKE